MQIVISWSLRYAAETYPGVIRQGLAGPYISWMPKFWSGQTQNSGGEGRDSNCFYLIGKYQTSQYAGMWDDVPCSHLDNFICES